MTSFDFLTRGFMMFGPRVNYDTKTFSQFWFWPAMKDKSGFRRMPAGKKRLLLNMLNMNYLIQLRGRIMISFRVRSRSLCIRT